MTMPPLPEPYKKVRIVEDADYPIDLHLYSPAQMRAYGEACAAAAIEQYARGDAEPVAFADRLAFDSAMRIGKGCDVWPVAGDYEARTGRELLPLYTRPSRPLTDEQIWGLAANCLDSVAGRLQFARAIERAHGVKTAEATTTPDSVAP